MFVAVLSGFDVVNGKPANRGARADRIRPDGTIPSPASINLGEAALGARSRAATEPASSS